MDYYGARMVCFIAASAEPQKKPSLPKVLSLMGKNKHPVECICQRRTGKKETLISQQKHLDLVRRLKAEMAFRILAMLDWTFANDNGRSPQMHHAHRYVEQWQTMRSEKHRAAVLGQCIGTGKSFLAGCIANALMEQEVPVCMTNFAHPERAKRQPFRAKRRCGQALSLSPAYY